MKTCSKCKELKPETEFPGQLKKAKWCKQCFSDAYYKRKQKAYEQGLGSKNVIETWVKRIKGKKDELGVSCADIARHLGLHEGNVQRWFLDNERKTVPKQKNIKAVCEFLGVDVPKEIVDGKGRVALGIGTCPSCGKEFPIYKAGVKHCSRACLTVTHAKKQVGSENPMWNGGLIKSGQYLKQLAEGHPSADASGYVFQHRLVIEAVLGRYLEPFERVHHKNGVRDDNRPENLELWAITGNSKKDPAGQRMEDLMRYFLEQPEVANHTDVQAIEIAFRRVFKI